MKHIITLILLLELTAFNSFGQYNENLVTEAEKGSIDAQIQLAKCYMEGNGVDQSEADALVWYEKAARNNSVMAMIACGDLLCNEYIYGFEPDYVRGMQWYSKAASKGSRKAKEIISNFDSSIKEEETDDCPYNWLPFDEDIERSDFLNLKTINKAYLAGNPIAAYYLAILAYKNGYFKLAVKYLSDIYPLVMNEDNSYEGIFDQEESGVPITYTIPAKVFSLLGWCYEHGEGVDRDLIKAAEYYLSEFDYYDFGMSKIPRVRGIYCYKKAGLVDKFIEGANTPAVTLGYVGRKSSGSAFYVPWLQVKLAEMYKTGDGVAQDKKKALEIYESVVDVRKDLIDLNPYAWYPETRSFSDVGKAAYEAYRMYKSGEGCRQDMDMAELYFEIALKYGDRSAWREYKKL